MPLGSGDCTHASMALQEDFGEGGPLTAKRPMVSTKRQTGGALNGGQHPAGAGAETDRHRALGLAARREGQFVAIFEESPNLATRKLDRPLAALADLEQRAESGLFGGRRG